MTSHTSNPARLRSLLVFAVLCAAIARFIPLDPAMPGPTLDDGWAIAMNQAVSQGLQFGRDLVFTFGPYASVYTRLYHPQTDTLMLGGSLLLALAFGFSVMVLARRSQWFWIAVTGLAVAATGDKDALLYGVALASCLAFLELIENGDDTGGSHFLIAVFVLAPFGLLPAIKGTMFILSVGMLGTCVFAALWLRRWGLALTCAIVPAAVLFVAWLLAGQSASSLPAYVLGIADVSSGYSEAMSLDGPSSDILVYLGAAALFVGVSAFTRGAAGTVRVLRVAAVSLFLFVAFKGGFVRHDAHVLMSASALTLGASLLAMISRARAATLLLVACLLASLGMSERYGGSIAHLALTWRDTYASLWKGLRTRTSHPEDLGRRYAEALKAINHQLALPALEGTTDVYSYGQSYLLASDNHWNPRPVLQSYSAYTPRLLELNRRHLTTADRPQNIFFRLEPLDGRFPATDDGASWPALLANYTPVAATAGYLQLEARAQAVIPAPLEPLGPLRRVRLGEDVPVPNSDRPVFITVRPVPSLLGRLQALLFKPNSLHMRVTLASGAVHSYRLVSGTAATPFLLSPLVDQTSAFSLLFGATRMLQGNAVRAVAFETAGTWRSWRDEIGVEFHQAGARELGQGAERLGSRGKLQEVETGARLGRNCDGSIDTIDARPAREVTAVEPSLLRVSGWLAASAKDGVLPQATQIFLEDGSGRRLVFSTARAGREDVAKYFQRPSLADSGFELLADVSGLSGTITIGLLLQTGETTYDCANIRSELKILRRDP
ncbi:hypothetical protein [Variovorax sp. J31P207]|uniref:hypothetical protein n=1 Tax=Variovorax sp. J31P207 TaxID=3053510 RepID=UPI002578AEB1|nr:hypothetical protein [Variovorax sp. J31P207]MDM0067883.1 hypothetical protein [Variovorax sp. J31P207]